MKGLIPAAQKLMPLMMVVFLGLMILQLVLSMHLSAGQLLHRVLGWLAQGGTVYAALGAALFALVLAGVVYEWRAEAAARKVKASGRRARPQKRGWLMDVLARLTNRAALEDLLAKQDKVIVIDAVALATTLKSQVIGQDAVCEDIAGQLRRRLALQVRGKPVGIFLLAGPPGTGKTYLAKKLASALGRKLLHFDMTQFERSDASSQMFGTPKGYVGSETYGKLTSGLKETPDALVLLDEIEKSHPLVLKKFLTAWNDGHVTEASDSSQIGTTRVIFVLTSNIATEALGELAERFADDPDGMRGASVEVLKQAGFAPEVLNRLDRIFVFKQLVGLDVARVAALEIEAMIGSYGLEIADGGIDPHLLLDVMQKQDRLGQGASARDLVRSIEEMVSDGLIEAHQQGARCVSLEKGPGGIVTRIADLRGSRKMLPAREALVPEVPAIDVPGRETRVPLAARIDR